MSKKVLKKDTKVSKPLKKAAKVRTPSENEIKTAKEINKDTKLNELIVHGMMEKKAHDITIVDLKSIKNAVADYFIICSGNSDTQVDAITDSIENEVFKITSQNPWHKEGQSNNEWVLLDYVDVVAHVFHKDKRKFYSLEELWGDAQITNIENA